MTLHTWEVGLSVTPTVIKTGFDHYLNRKKRKQKPTAHVSYDVALHLIRQFLYCASFHTVEDVQAFTAQWVPTPTWIRTEHLTIPDAAIENAATHITKQLGPGGVKQVGGKTWWKWRRDGQKLQADWIEMRSDFRERQKSKSPCTRVMFYVHGGAYFFGSVDEHRYQLQRHARKLKARVFAPRYRLAPQFPFPCGLHDCLAAYLHLLTLQDPTTIIMAGDSAGGGMVTSLLVVLRDQGIPMPAGAVLISPWVDLTHSFPSVAATNDFDYIPPYGFMQKPSISWPPPNADDLHMLRTVKTNETTLSHKLQKETTIDAAQGVVVKDPAEGAKTGEGAEETTIPGKNLSLMIDGKEVYLRDQIQMYATNELLSHPLVSPALQPSLGGLPPLLILVGGGEMLRDEQIYLAHKAAHPSKYPPGEVYLNQTPGAREEVTKHNPTLVQLQVWDDLCHVAPTLSFTRPAKYMYRSIAQFGAWALAQAQRTDIEIVDDDDVSVISSYTSSSDDGEQRATQRQKKDVDLVQPVESIGKAGDDIPHFKNHMVRQRVDRNGFVYHLAPESDLPALQMKPEDVGVVKPGPVRKWMNAKAKWDVKYARQKRNVQKKRMKEMKKGYSEFKEDGVTEVPPPSAMAGRRGLTDTTAPKAKKSMGLMFWSMMGSSHDKDAITREEKLDRDAEATKITVTEAQGATSTQAGLDGARPRSGSRRRTISYQKPVDENTPAAELVADSSGAPEPIFIDNTAASIPQNPNMLSPTFIPLSKANASDKATTAPTLLPVDAAKDPLVLEGTNVTLASPEHTRPKADGVAFPFKLGKSLAADYNRNASTVTLMSSLGEGTSTPRTDAGPNSPLSEMTPTAAGITEQASSRPQTAVAASSAVETTPKAPQSAILPAAIDLPPALGPVRTETPTLEQQLNSMASKGTGRGGNETPRASNASGGFATPLLTPGAESIATGASSEAGDRPALERFSTAEELFP